MDCSMSVRCLFDDFSPTSSGLNSSGLKVLINPVLIHPVVGLVGSTVAAFIRPSLGRFVAVDRSVDQAAQAQRSVGRSGRFISVPRWTSRWFVRSPQSAASSSSAARSVAQASLSQSSLQRPPVWMCVWAYMSFNIKSCMNIRYT